MWHVASFGTRGTSVHPRCCCWIWAVVMVLVLAVPDVLSLAS